MIISKSNSSCLAVIIILLNRCLIIIISRCFRSRRSILDPIVGSTNSGLGISCYILMRSLIIVRRRAQIKIINIWKVYKCYRIMRTMRGKIIIHHKNRWQVQVIMRMCSKLRSRDMWIILRSNAFKLKRMEYRNNFISIAGAQHNKRDFSLPAVINHQSHSFHRKVVNCQILRIWLSNRNVK